MPKTPKKKKITYIKKGTKVRVTNCIGKERVGIMEGCNDVLGHIILGDGFRLAFGYGEDRPSGKEYAIIF